jgi:perosamine synthetase
MEEIPLFKPFLSPDVPEAVQRVMTTGALASGPAVAAFENDLRAYIGSDHIATVSNSSDGIGLALNAADIRPGDEVVMSPLCCLSTSMPFLAHGVNIRWCDIDLKIGMPGIEDVKRAATDRTKAILVYHWNGHIGPIEGIQSWARDLGLSVIEDATEAFAGRVSGRHIGNQTADFTVFSFHAAKYLNTGEGAAVSVADTGRFERLERMRKLGIDVPSFRLGDGDLNPASPISHIGFSSSLDNVSASVGRENIKHLDELLTATRRNVRALKEGLDGARHITFLEDHPNSEPVPWTLNIRLDDREKWKNALRRAGIACQRLHLRCDRYAAFPDAGAELDNVRRFDEENLSIPCGWWLSEDDIERIIAILNPTSGS